MSMKQDSVDDSTTVATCRQTVEASLATPHHRLAADGYVSAPNDSARSHLSPDGGSLPRHAYHRLAADGYGVERVDTVWQR